jgi:hypothetical protein
MALGKSFPKAQYSHALFWTPPMGLTGALGWARPPSRAAQARRAGMELNGFGGDGCMGLFSAGVEGLLPLALFGRNRIAP